MTASSSVTYIYSERGREGGAEGKREHLLDERQLQYSVWCHTQCWCKQIVKTVPSWSSSMIRHRKCSGCSCTALQYYVCLHHEWHHQHRGRGMDAGAQCKWRTTEQASVKMYRLPSAANCWLVNGDFWQWAPGEEHSDFSMYEGLKDGRLSSILPIVPKWR